MRKLKATLQKIVGRLKKKMAEWLLTWGSVFLPASIVFMILGFNLKGEIVLWCFVIACVFVVAGSYYMLRAWSVLENNQSKEDKRFNDLINEIKGLRQDMRGGKDDHTDSGKPN